MATRVPAASFQLLALPTEILSLVPRSLCASDLARLSLACKQCGTICLKVAEDFLAAMLATGKVDRPLPPLLADCETPLHRLARLCGVRFAPANFHHCWTNTCLYLCPRSSPGIRVVPTELAAIEKAYAVLSEIEVFGSGHALARGGRAKSVECARWIPERGVMFDEDNFAAQLCRRAVHYMEYECGGVLCVKHVDMAIAGMASPPCESTLAAMNSYPIHDPDYTAEDESDTSDDEPRGIEIDGEWIDSIHHLTDSPHGGGQDIYCEFVADAADWVNRSLFGTTYDIADPSDGPAPCASPLCCHTYRNCRLVDHVNYYSIDFLAGLPGTGRWNAITCPRVLFQRQARAEFRRWKREVRANPARKLAEIGVTYTADVPRNKTPVL